MSNEKTLSEMSAEAFGRWQLRKIEEQEQRAFVVRELPRTLANIEERLRRLETMSNVAPAQPKDDAQDADTVELWHIRGLMDALDKLSDYADSFGGFTASAAQNYADEYRATGAGGGDPQLRTFRANVLQMIVDRHCDELAFNEAFNKTGEK
jgi:hypothetical protein